MAVTIPPFAGYTSDNSTSLFSACSSGATAAIYPPLACGDNTLCTRNPLFSIFTGSNQVCLCPLTAYPLVNGTCQTIAGTSCTTDQDCSDRSADCVGLSGFGLETSLVEFLLPVVVFVCQLTVEFSFQVPVWSCTGNTCAVVGIGTPSIFSGGFPGRRKREVSIPSEAIQEDHDAPITASVSRETRSEAEAAFGPEISSVGDSKLRQKRWTPTVACTPAVQVWGFILSFFTSQTSTYVCNSSL
ncbi:uncharacterized protein LOC106154477 [Lingula anatina]|uniref:Uncharacterized protein LOC106154477 n=1 Tax=Lingula anatina TaxID=7574 RepID=A0A1S3HE04_LINAN|nr:uncharacterized protein LOC106154477 [Lingula anatina]|eukprot:XP_013384283.1 uncharacterized protein LOC106154477 [Lingula anatina]